jgi:ADP-heptose:LPS heptosyltransferase
MKILVVRFSSIGDIVLTTPVIRCIKNQVPNAEIHFLTKENFIELIELNPNIHKIHSIKKTINECLSDLKKEKFDFLVDLHNNVRTLSLKRKLAVSSAAFPKLNVAKWILVNFKWNKLPQKHVVERYFEAVKSLKVENDNKACDFFLQPSDEVDVLSQFFVAHKSYVSLAIGAQYATKRIPLEKLIEICDSIQFPILLLGGNMDAELAEQLILGSKNQKIYSACGKLTIRQSASVLKQSAVLLTNDTGLMHIASCFQTPTISVWGSTVPALGMYPYFPQKKEAFSIHEVMNLSCRPCSKIGHQNCPKKHFNCMMKQDSHVIAQDVNTRFEASHERMMV